MYEDAACPKCACRSYAANKPSRCFCSIPAPSLFRCFFNPSIPRLLTIAAIGYFPRTIILRALAAFTLRSTLFGQGVIPSQCTHMYLNPVTAPYRNRRHERKNEGSSSAATAGRLRRASAFSPVCVSQLFLICRTCDKARYRLHERRLAPHTMTIVPVPCSGRLES